ncbi:hypothetical protein [Mesorhizobium sp. M2A.F.Ca.ET.067.02.1.1]|uniref:hypothetical protein n=1 Tax=Mesorhizobium sp. M2A.F.Ca.ET.067.02.1.1 TaxID=2496749 RepID=UPI00167BE407|nr:hypothetical protein [Mesorhizobium sp. M2A.F.Ca.ET.067.02.1.1]
MRKGGFAHLARYWTSAADCLVCAERLSAPAMASSRLLPAVDIDHERHQRPAGVADLDVTEVGPVDLSLLARQCA